MTNSTKALHFLLTISAVMVWLTLMFSAPETEIGIAAAYGAMLVISTGTLILVRQVTGPTRSTADPVERAKQEYVEGDITEYEFEQRLEDAMEDGEQ